MTPQLPNPSPPASVDLPATFLPIFVDRFVAFVYTATYDDESKKKIRHLQNATHFPSPSSADSYGRLYIKPALFHLHMCALAEQLKYPELYETAYDKLTHHLLRAYCDPSALHAIIDATFAAPDSDAPLCEYKDEGIRNLVVAAMVVQEHKFYTDRHRDTLRELLSGTKYESFLMTYRGVKAECKDLLPVWHENPRRSERMAKVKAAAAAAVVEGRIGKGKKGRGAKRNLGHEQAEERRRTAAVLKGLENMGLE